MVTTALAPHAPANRPPAALHPSARRRLTEGMAHPPAHDVILRPLGAGSATAMIATAHEQSFIDAVLSDLTKSDWRDLLAGRQGKRRGADGVLELQQPIHKRFHLALFEAVCRTPGSPRLDPRKIDGMGLVLRRDAGAQAPGRTRLRLAPRADLGRQPVREGWDGWMSAGPIHKGWAPISAEEADPDPSAQNTLRPASAQSTLKALIAQKSGAAPLATEEVLPLFAASPDVCQAVGATVLYGLVPVASPETSDSRPQAPTYADDPDAAKMRAHFSSYLKARASQAMPNAGQQLDPSWQPLKHPEDGDSNAARLYNVGVFLQQMTGELAAFDDDRAAAQHLRSLLGKIHLPLAKDSQGAVTHATTAADFAKLAAPILLSSEPNPSGAIMPLEWPAVDATLGGQLSDACLARLAERFNDLSPNLPKFYGDSVRYAIRGFIRVQHDPACPPELIWSDYSEPFRIVPWWDSDGPVARISLPGVGSLKNLKPNVSFEVPSDLGTMLQGDPTKLVNGQGSTSPDLGIMWLCSFSLPAITICAYIVLSIFIGLFNLVFWWSAWIKICIPIPRPK
ncbi:MAG TPA: hypothetical protein VN694_09755 [Caulobacteraceae bacterium]|nr:hypothetical protein [Caulobacteraceae bacterium]